MTSTTQAPFDYWQTQDKEGPLTGELAFHEEMLPAVIHDTLVVETQQKLRNQRYAKPE